MNVSNSTAALQKYKHAQGHLQNKFKNVITSIFDVIALLILFTPVFKTIFCQSRGSLHD